MNLFKSSRNIYIKVAAGLAIVVIFFFSADSNQTVTASNAETLKKRLEKISDGDTLSFENMKCRVLYIDTPEKFESDKLYRLAGKCKIDSKRMVKAGQLSSKKSEEFLKIGDLYTVVSKEKDKYDRNLCEVKNKMGVDYGEYMLEQGYAVLFKDGDWIKDSAIKNRLKSIQDKARNQRKGLWGGYSDVMECMAKN